MSGETADLADVETDEQPNM